MTSLEQLYQRKKELEERLPLASEAMKWVVQIKLGSVTEEIERIQKKAAEPKQDPLF